MANGRQSILLASLRLNKENDRHGPLPSEVDCIAWLLTHHRDHMLNLAKDIAEFGMSPIEGILVLPASDGAPGAFDVWEGNRRVAATKLLDDSNRCPDAQLRRKFQAVASGAKIPIPTSIECVVASSEEEANRLIELRHQGVQDGIGTVAWDARQKDRHQERLGKRGRYAIANQVLDAVLEKIDPAIKQKIEEDGIAISTLDRVLKNPAAQKFLGLTTASGVVQRIIDEKEALKGLSKVIADIAGGMHVSEVYDDKAIRKYLGKFSAKDKPNLTKTIAKPAALTPTVGKPGAGPKSKPRSHKRRRLIPPNVTFAISEKRVNLIYHELKRLDVDEHRNAVAVLHRVFLELTVDWYLDNFGISYPPADKLKNKIGRVVSDMATKGWIKGNEAKGINATKASVHGPHSMDTFHSYIHNRLYLPAPSDLTTAFDNLQPFYAALFKQMP
jgi:hypothetical protein